MAAGAHAALIMELEDAIVRCPQERRTLVIEKVIQLFVSAHSAAIGDPDPLDDVLVCLIRRAELDDLRKLSLAIATSGLKLPMSVRQLAFHHDASVAAPVLRESNLVSELDLRELAQTRSQQHLLAISSRSMLSEVVCTSLVMRGNASVHARISQNLGARVSNNGFVMLLKIAERDETLAAALGRRSDISSSLVRKFLALATGNPRAAFLKVASPEVQALVKAEAPAGARHLPHQTDYAPAEKEVAVLARAGKLTDSVVNSFVVGQEIEKLTAALAFLSGAPTKVIEHVLWAETHDELIMACRAAGLRFATAASIIQHRQDCAPLSEQQLEVHSRLFEGMSLSEAQRTIRFGQADAGRELRTKAGGSTKRKHS